jgi:hypothetical protein
VQQLLEPQLIDLMDDDEEQLVVGGCLGPLQFEELGQGQVAAVVQAAALLAEAGARRLSPRRS